jgi:hypothetical protein
MSAFICLCVLMCIFDDNFFHFLTYWSAWYILMELCTWLQRSTTSE